MIGDQIFGNLPFKSSDRERGFLAEASEAFGFPLMEKVLMKTGMPNMLWCAQDFSLKAMIAARCVDRQLQAEGSSRMQLKKKIAELKKGEIYAPGGP